MVTYIESFWLLQIINAYHALSDMLSLSGRKVRYENWKGNAVDPAVYPSFEKNEIADR